MHEVIHGGLADVLRHQGDVSRSQRDDRVGGRRRELGRSGDDDVAAFTLDDAPRAGVGRVRDLELRPHGNRPGQVLVGSVRASKVGQPGAADVPEAPVP